MSALPPESLRALLQQADPAAIQQGCELLACLSDVAASVFAGGHIDASGRPVAGPLVRAWVHADHRLWMTLWGLQQQGRLQQAETLDLSALAEDRARDLFPAVHRLQSLKMVWDGTRPLDGLPPSLAALNLVVSGRPMVFGGAPPDWRLLASLEGLRTLTITGESNRLPLEDLSPFAGLHGLTTLTLVFFRLPDREVTLSLPALATLGLKRLESRAVLRLSLPGLAALTLDEISSPPVVVETLHLRSTPNLEDIKIPQGCSVQALPPRQPS